MHMGDYLRPGKEQAGEQSEAHTGPWMLHVPSCHSSAECFNHFGKLYRNWFITLKMSLHHLYNSLLFLWSEVSCDNQYLEGYLLYLVKGHCKFVYLLYLGVDFLHIPPWDSSELNLWICFSSVHKVLFLSTLTLSLCFPFFPFCFSLLSGT